MVKKITVHKPLNKPSYYAVIIAEVRYDKSLPPNAKLLYGEITALSGTDGYCKAGDNYFANLYGTTVRTVQYWIKSLIDNGYITRGNFVDDKGKTVSGRYLKITAELVNTKKRRTYNQIFEDLVTSPELKIVMIEFIRHCQINRRTLTDLKLEDILINLDMTYIGNEQAKINAVLEAIRKGYFDIKRL